MAPFAGPEGRIGRAVEVGVALAVEEANGRGGLRGTPVVVFAEAAAEATAARQAIGRLAGTPHLALVVTSSRLESGVPTEVPSTPVIALEPPAELLRATLGTLVPPGASVALLRPADSPGPVTGAVLALTDRQVSDVPFTSAASARARLRETVVHDADLLVIDAGPILAGELAALAPASRRQVRVCAGRCALPEFVQIAGDAATGWLMLFAAPFPADDDPPGYAFARRYQAISGVAALPEAWLAYRATAGALAALGQGNPLPEPEFRPVIYDLYGPVFPGRIRGR